MIQQCELMNILSAGIIVQNVGDGIDYLEIYKTMKNSFAVKKVMSSLQYVTRFIEINELLNFALKSIEFIDKLR